MISTISQIKLEQKKIIFKIKKYVDKQYSSDNNFFYKEENYFINWAETEGKFKLISVIKNLINVFFILKNDVGDTLPLSGPLDNFTDLVLNPNVYKILFSGELELGLGVAAVGSNVYNFNAISTTFTELGKLVKTAVDTHTTPSIVRTISWKISEYLSKLHKSPLLDDLSKSTSFWDISSSKKYFRDSNGVLYLVKPDGEHEPFDKIKYEDAKICTTVGVRATDKDGNVDNFKCVEYIENCLRGNNLDKCKSYLSDPDTRFTMTDEVKSMNPIAIKEFADALKIGKKKITEGIMSYDVLVSVNEWLSSLKKSGFTTDEIKNLIQYFREQI